MILVLLKNTEVKLLLNDELTYKLQFASHNGTRVQVNNNGRTDLIVMEIAS